MVTSIPNNPDDTDPQQAIECFRRGDLPEALRRADAIIAAAPGVGMSWRFKGECLFQMGRFLDAAECFHRAEDCGGPGTDEVFFWRALALHNGGRTVEAIVVFRDFLREQGGQRPDVVPKVQAALGKLEQLQGQSAAAGRGGPPPLVLAPDDPLMNEARQKARATAERLRAYFALHPQSCSAKVLFRTDGGRFEHLWGRVRALSADAVRVTLINRPVTHAGPVPVELEIPWHDLDDWEVALPDGRIAGGFTTRVMFVRAKEQWGELPADMADHQSRYVDG